MLPNRPSHWVGREPEFAAIRAAADRLGRGEGSVIWVEGEPGIGKTALLAETLAVIRQPGWEVGWAGADQLTRLPLRVMVDCLGARPDSPDPRRRHAASLLQDRVTDGDASANGIEILLMLADELCAAAPTVLVADDLQWADEASLAVWHELAAAISQLRLLLIGTSRPAPDRPRVQQIRTAIARGGGHLVRLGPMAEPEVTALVTAMVGAAPGEGLRRLAAQAAGNPLYLRELLDGLMREQAVQIRPVADIISGAERLPASLPAVLDGRLGSVSDEAAQLLRAAALLGGRFAVADLSVVLRRPVVDLAEGLREAVGAGLVDGAGPELTFRHPLIRESLYLSMPEAVRTALHAEAARELATVGADVLSVAQQLHSAGQAGAGPAGASPPGAGWSRSWLVQAAPALTSRAPELAVELQRRELDATPVGGEVWDALIIGLVRALLQVGGYQEAIIQGNRALAVMTDPARRGETFWMLTHARGSAGDGNEAAVSTMRQALATAGLPLRWQARILSLLAMFEREVTGFDASRALGQRALAAAEESGDLSATAHALVTLWLISSVGRDHAAALASVDRALLIMGDDPGYDDLHSTALDGRTFTLQNLDQWEPATLALRQSREFALRTGRPDRATWASAAVLRYWLGQWDDALAEMDSDAADAPGLVYSWLRERWSALLVHGLAALIAGRREQRTEADKHLREGLALPIDYLTDRENRDFLVAAHALSLEQRGETRQAMERLAELIPRPANEMTLAHQWLPDLVRLALAVGEPGIARAAAQACALEASAGTRPAAASLRCHGLLESDPEKLRAAVSHYREVGPAVELPAALEDLAVVLAERGDADGARSALNEAADLYEAMGARWDIRRAEGRLRPHGIRRGVRGRRAARPVSGWAALTSTEVTIAALVARGDSTADIARGLFLSRRTVQTYISRILVKLDAGSRVDIAREALQRGATP